jgi:hypothetical protein
MISKDDNIPVDRIFLSENHAASWQRSGRCCGLPFVGGPHQHWLRAGTFQKELDARIAKATGYSSRFSFDHGKPGLPHEGL